MLSNNITIAHHNINISYLHESNFSYITAEVILLVTERSNYTTVTLLQSMYAHK